MNQGLLETYTDKICPPVSIVASIRSCFPTMMAVSSPVATGHQICVSTAFSVLRRSCLIRRCCLMRLQNMSTRLRLSWSAQTICAGNALLWVTSTLVCADSESLDLILRKLSVCGVPFDGRSE